MPTQRPDHAAQLRRDDRDATTYQEQVRVAAVHATVFAITSDMDSARHQYDHMIMLNEGRVVWQGRTQDIDASGNPYVLQLVNGRAEGPIKMRLKVAGCCVSHRTRRECSP